MRAALPLLIMFAFGGIAAEDLPNTPSLRIVRAYDAWKDHDPASPRRTEARLAAYAAECGTQTGPFELLRVTTPREAARTIAREIDAAVPATIERAFARAAAALPGPPLTVCVYAGELSRGLPYLGGVGGIAIGGGRVKLFLHPTTERFAKVPYTVAHEYHHEVQRFALPFGGPDDVVVREGKADHFAAGLFPALRPPHTAPLSDAELAVVWPAFLEFRLGRLAQADFMIASKGPLPMWAGYRLAYEMVANYVRSTGTGAAAMLSVPSAAIIETFSRSPRVARLLRNPG